MDGLILCQKINNISGFNKSSSIFSQLFLQTHTNDNKSAIGASSWRSGSWSVISRNQVWQSHDEGVKAFDAEPIILEEIASSRYTAGSKATAGRIFMAKNIFLRICFQGLVAQPPRGPASISSRWHPVLH